MRIVAATVHPVRLPKRTTFQVTYATRTACRSALLRLETDDGRVGWGEAVPVAEVTGERRPEAYEQLARFAREHLVGVDPLAQEELRLLLRENLAAWPSARCAVDTALWDLRGQVLGLSVRQLLGGLRTSFRASCSLGIKDTAATLAEVRRLLAAGFRDIKLKVGLDREADEARVKAIRAELGRDFRLYLDANQGYTPPEAINFLEAVADQDVELVEQPVAADDLAGLAEVTRQSPIRVVADEAIKGPESLIPLISRKAAHLVNIKLQKCGGPSEAETLVRLAEAAGLGAMVGCMIESRVGITAGLSVALALGNVHYIDLDGAFDLVDDLVAEGGAQFDAGRQFLAEGPGLGLLVDEEKLARYRDEAPEEER
ncbi:MAG: mandelate racemase/muconate lactonizing enzyme family protein [Betaproteobacteria bacterium]